MSLWLKVSLVSVSFVLLFNILFIWVVLSVGKKDRKRIKDQGFSIYKEK